MLWMLLAIPSLSFTHGQGKILVTMTVPIGELMSFVCMGQFIVAIDMHDIVVYCKCYFYMH